MNCLKCGRPAEKECRQCGDWFCLWCYERHVNRTMINLIADCRAEVARMREGSSHTETPKQIADRLAKEHLSPYYNHGDIRRAIAEAIERERARVNSTEAECALVEGLCAELDDLEQVPDSEHPAIKALKVHLRRRLTNWLRPRGEK